MSASEVAPGPDAAIEATVIDTIELADPTQPAPSLRQGGYAGIVSRIVALSTDAIVLAIASIGTLFVVQAVVAMFKSLPFGEVTIAPEWGIAIVVFESAVYFTAAWAVFGRTGGEALFGLRMVRRDGRPVSWPRAFFRYLTWPLAYAVCGLGFVWILIDNRRRTWADIVAGTVVVYDWRHADDHLVDPAIPHA